MLNEYGINDDDVIIFSDADEVVSGEYLYEIKCDKKEIPVRRSAKL